VSAGLRILFVRGRAASTWRAGFDLAQAAAALDVPLELGFAGDAVELIVPAPSDTAAIAGSGVWASLALLGVEHVHAPAACRDGLDLGRAALPVRWLDPGDWRAWLRRAPMQVW
jgi:hypothetical protein